MGNKKIFKFNKQLSIGKKGELNFIKNYKSLGARLSRAREYDILVNDNEKLELKSDSYSESNTPNMFLEKVGVSTTKKAGGPFLSVIHNCKYFVYHYIQNNTFYWFRPEDLCDYINKNEKNLQKREIWNRGYNSVGFLVPRKDVENLLIRFDKF